MRVATRELVGVLGLGHGQGAAAWMHLWLGLGVIQPGQ